MPAFTQHHRALPYDDVPTALATIDAAGASLAAKACLRFVVLTACRSGEARGATWDEIDAGRREWLVPASRMKTGFAHRQPLSEQALEVLERVRPLHEPGALLFPSPTRAGRPLSDMTLMKVLRDNALAARTTVHGFRTAFRTWASERTDAPETVMELALAHLVGSAATRAYARSDLLEKRRVLMERWGTFAEGGLGEHPIA